MRQRKLPLEFRSAASHGGTDFFRYREGRDCHSHGDDTKNSRTLTERDDAVFNSSDPVQRPLTEAEELCVYHSPSPLSPFLWR